MSLFSFVDLSPLFHSIQNDASNRIHQQTGDAQKCRNRQVNRKQKGHHLDVPFPALVTRTANKLLARDAIRLTTCSRHLVSASPCRLEITLQHLVQALSSMEYPRFNSGDRETHALSRLLGR